MTTTNSSFPLLGKTAIVTGASRGIGVGIAFKLAEQGANVFLGYTAESSGPMAEELRAKLESLPHKPKAFCVQADLSEIDGPKKMIDKVLEQTKGDLTLDILVNNAGSGGVKPLSEISLEDYEYTYNLNVRGLILMTKAVLPYLQPKGRIINISSIGAWENIKGTSLYGSSKAAVNSLTRIWANELGENGTTVNSVCPGPVMTELLQQVLEKAPSETVEMQRNMTAVERRFGTIEEIADVVAWLASPAGAWITGQSISASGGLVMNP